MKRFFTYLFVLITMPILANAQNVNNHNVSGIIIDGELDEPMPLAAVQILELPDSSQAKGVVTDMDGAYSATSLKNGELIKSIICERLSASKLYLKMLTKNLNNTLFESDI